MTRITIIGGGSLGHVCAAVLGSQADTEVTMLTQRPLAWSTQVSAVDNDGKTYQSAVTATADTQSAIEQADIVLLTLPGFLIEKNLQAIRPYLRENTTVGSIVSSTGFFFFAHRILDKKTPLFGFQRVPFIARVAEYGKKGLLLGYKSELFMATENITEAEAFASLMAQLLGTPIHLLESFYEAALTNSNPILHTGRLYAMWHEYNGEKRAECGLFYREWDNASSETIIQMDEEFQQLLTRLPVREGIIPTLLTYYESTDAASLTRKIQSIKAFENITSPMIETESGWGPDFESRYFTEDFPFGLRFIYELAKEHQIDTPMIDRVYAWGMSIVNR